MATFAIFIFFYFFGLASIALTAWIIIVCWRFFRDMQKRKDDEKK